MDDPSTFKFTKILSTNPSQKRITMLGTVQHQHQHQAQKQNQTHKTQPQSQPQAIMILNAKMPTPQTLKFQKSTKIFKNDIYTRFDVVMQGQYQIQCIYPVTQKHKNKYQQKKMLIMKQTAEQYAKGEKELLGKQLGHLGWVQNILTGKAEAQRVLVRMDQFVILPDFKFSNMKQIQNLHLLVIFTDKSLHSIRDLRAKHIPTLKKLQSQISLILSSNFNLQQGSCRIFFHYPPTFYQLHAHITILKSQAGNALTQRAHLLWNVISNLEVQGQYYGKVTLVKTVEIQVQMQKEEQKEKMMQKQGHN